MIGYVVAGAMVLGLFVGASLYIAVLQDRVKKERWERERVAQNYDRIRAQEGQLVLEVIQAREEATKERDANRTIVAEVLERQMDLVEKLTVAPPTPEGSAPDLTLTTDRDPTEVVEDMTDWTDGLAFGGIDPTAGQMAPGMPTAEEIMRGEGGG